MISQSTKTNIIIIASLFLAISSSWFLAKRNDPAARNKTNITAMRIVSGYAAFTEILIAIDIKDRIVAANSADAKELQVPSIGSHMKPDIEAIIAARPDLVILSSRRPQLVEILRDKLVDTKILIVAEYPHTVDDTFKFIQKLGRLTKTENKANMLVEQAEFSLQAIDNAVAAVPESKRPIVFLEVRNSPSLLTCGKDSIAYDIIRRAGGIPAFTLSGSVLHIDIEDLIVAKPDFYIQQYGAMNRNPPPPSQHQIIGELACVKNGSVLKIDEKLISRPGPRVTAAIIKLHKELYNGK